MDGLQHVTMKATNDIIPTRHIKPPHKNSFCFCSVRFVTLLADRPVGAVDRVRAGIVVPITTLTDCIPLCFSAHEGNARKVGAI